MDKGFLFLLVLVILITVGKALVENQGFWIALHLNMKQRNMKQRTKKHVCSNNIATNMFLFFPQLNRIYIRTKFFFFFFTIELYLHIRNKISSCSYLNWYLAKSCGAHEQNLCLKPTAVFFLCWKKNDC